MNVHIHREHYGKETVFISLMPDDPIFSLAALRDAKAVLRIGENENKREAKNEAKTELHEPKTTNFRKYHRLLISGTLPATV